MYGNPIATMPCPPAPKKGFTIYYDKTKNEWIFVKSQI